MMKFTLPKEEANILMQVVLNAPANERGYTIADNRSALKVADTVELITKEGGEVTLEDSQHSWLVQRLNAQTWAIASKTIVNLVDLVEKATPPEKE